MFRRLQNLFDGENRKIAYKIAHDSLFILLLFFTLVLIAEGLLPGIISDHFGIYKIFVAIILNSMAVKFLADKLKNKIKPSAQVQEKGKKKMIAFIILISILFINSILETESFVILVLFALTLLSGIWIHKIMAES